MGACALTGEGLHEGLGWLAATLKDAHMGNLRPLLVLGHFFSRRITISCE